MSEIEINESAISYSTVTKGSCLCRGVEIELEGRLRPVVNCHCTQCLKTHGNFAAYTNVSKEQLRIVSQQTLSWYRSSDVARRGFCHRCGASIFWSRDEDETVSVSAGVLDVPTGLSTVSNIFVDSKSDYYVIPDSPSNHAKGL